MPKVRSIGLVLFSFPLNSWSDLATLVNCKDSGQEGSGVGLRRRRVHGGVGPGPHPRGPRTTLGGPQSSSPWAKLPVVRAGARFSGPSQCSVLLSRRGLCRCPAPTPPPPPPLARTASSEPGLRGRRSRVDLKRGRSPSAIL